MKIFGKVVLLFLLATSYSRITYALPNGELKATDTIPFETSVSVVANESEIGLYRIKFYNGDSGPALANECYMLNADNRTPCFERNVVEKFTRDFTRMDSVKFAFDGHKTQKELILTRQQSYREKILQIGTSNSLLFEAQGFPSSIVKYMFESVPIGQAVAPVALATVTTIKGSAPLQVKFSSRESFNPTGGKLIYEWSFGDGTIGMTSAPQVHTYSAPGTYTAVLTVRNQEGTSSEFAIPIEVLAPVEVLPPKKLPVASLVINGNPGQINIQFDTRQSHDSTGTIVSRELQFGDGTFASDEFGNHTYPGEGTYVAQLRVINDRGHAGTIEKSVKLVPDQYTLGSPVVETSLTGFEARPGSKSISVILQPNEADDLYWITIENADGGDHAPVKQCDGFTNSLACEYQNWINEKYRRTYRTNTLNAYINGKRITAIGEINENVSVYSAPIKLRESNVVTIDGVGGAEAFVSLKIHRVLPAQTFPGMRIVASGLNSENSFLKAIQGFDVVSGDTDFNTSKNNFAILLGNRLLRYDEYQISSRRITVLSAPLVGKNDLKIVGMFKNGTLFQRNFTFWAGSDNATVTIVGSSSESLVLKAEIAGTASIFQLKQTDGDQAVFESMPRAFAGAVIYSSTNRNFRGFTFSNLNLNEYTLSTFPLGLPSAENLDLHNSISGWDVSSGSVSVTAVSDPLLTQIKKSEGSIKLNDRLKGKFKKKLSEVANTKGTCTLGSCTLVLSTMGGGPKATSHTFTATKNSYKIRYRFKSLEVWNGYYQTPFDDSFVVGYRDDDKMEYRAGSMNTLGKGSFDIDGLSEWMELTVNTSIGKTVEIFAYVNNGNDELYDSLLQLDFNQPAGLQLVSTPVVNALSVGSSPYRGGVNTIDAALELQSAPGSVISSLSLSALINGQRFSGSLNSDAGSAIGSVFDSTGKMNIAAKFDLSTGGLVVPPDAEASLTISATATGAGGAVAASDGSGKLNTLLSQYDNQFRDPGLPIDASTTGFDWVLPSIQDPLNFIGANYSLFRETSSANANQTGSDVLRERGNLVDLIPSWYSLHMDLTEQDAMSNAQSRVNVATMLKQMLADPMMQNRIKLIWVDGRFWKNSEVQTDPFWQSIYQDEKAKNLVRPRTWHISRMAVMLW